MQIHDKTCDPLAVSSLDYDFDSLRAVDRALQHLETIITLAELLKATEQSDFTLLQGTTMHAYNLIVQAAQLAQVDVDSLIIRSAED